MENMKFSSFLVGEDLEYQLFLRYWKASPIITSYLNKNNPAVLTENKMCPKREFKLKAKFPNWNYQAYDYKHHQYKLFKHQRSAVHSIHLFKHIFPQPQLSVCVHKGKKNNILPTSSCSSHLKTWLTE